MKAIDEKMLPKNDEGRILMPYCWEFPWVLKVEEAWKETEIIQKKGNETIEHYFLKRACVLFGEQYWGMPPESFLCEEDIEYETQLRPDLTLQVDHKDLNIAFECGELSYKNKIKHLLTAFDFDMVIWLPYPVNKQFHWFADVPFYRNCIESMRYRRRGLPPTSSFIMASTGLYTAFDGEKHYVAAYNTINPMWPNEPLRFHVFTVNGFFDEIKKEV